MKEDIFFTKMHGTGNDYIFIENSHLLPYPVSELAKLLSRRRFGIGADGIICIDPSDIAAARMRIFNADGSEAEMCGNGLRCVAKYLNDNRLHNRQIIAIETGAGIVNAEIVKAHPAKSLVSVTLPEPEFAPEKIPLNQQQPLINEIIPVSSELWDAPEAVVLSMGNPHCVFYCHEPVESLNLRKIGPLYENHPLFPQRVNVEFVQILSQNKIRIRVWERGSGETAACGSGACAATVAGLITKKIQSPCEVILNGGSLTVHWEREQGVQLTGPAETVYKGKIDHSIMEYLLNESKDNHHQ